MKDNEERKPEPEEEKDKPPWQRPRFEVVGTIADFVHGGGKSGSNIDSDPQMMFKSGMG